MYRVSEISFSVITFRTAISTNKIQNIADYLLWYVNDKPQMFRRPLFMDRPEERVKKLLRILLRTQQKMQVSYLNRKNWSNALLQRKRNLMLRDSYTKAKSLFPH